MSSSYRVYSASNTSWKAVTDLLDDTHLYMVRNQVKEITLKVEQLGPFPIISTMRYIETLGHKCRVDVIDGTEYIIIT